MNFIKAHWKAVLIGVVVLVFLAWVGSISGTNRKLYDMILGSLREDRDRIIADQKTYIKDCEDEISRLAIEKEAIRKEKVRFQDLARESAAEIARLEEGNRELERQLRDIVVGANADVIIDNLRKRGLSTIRRHR
jgi:chromosome segregation ATPase